MSNQATVYLENNEVPNFRDFISSNEDGNFNLFKKPEIQRGFGYHIKSVKS